MFEDSDLEGAYETGNTWNLLDKYFTNEEVEDIFWDEWNKLLIERYGEDWQDLKYRRLYFVCDNTEQPDTESEDIVYLEVPLYEECSFQNSLEKINLFDMDDIMSLFSFRGERTYFSLYILEQDLIKVRTFDYNTCDGLLELKYTFEDGGCYIPEGCPKISELNENEFFKFVDMAKEAAKHMFRVTRPLKANMFSFEGERWG